MVTAFNFDEAYNNRIHMYNTRMISPLEWEQASTISVLRIDELFQFLIHNGATLKAQDQATKGESPALKPCVDQSIFQVFGTVGGSR